jgi:DNA polymerase-3 subunit delta'
LFDWYAILGVQNKQARKSEWMTQEILKSLSLKSYEGGYNMIIWMADKLNIAASNKLLKLLEDHQKRRFYFD